ncbi:homoserine O- acetyltransferase [Mortierella polycephala]|uniref:Homoserine O- acetyltransferase n=1 Tax=Mortierella polycephala TaxID=41804 RepID=A0A9P6U9M3_9FUNG|nr:homoserine O- acetyltransferase [Mortierella polycephala]
MPTLEHQSAQPENPFSRLVPDQTIAIVPEFTLESGFVIRDVPVAYKTWGTLNNAGDNCMVICHPLTRSVDVEDWWSNLMGSCGLEGKGKVIDESKFFVVCLNVLGSPYGSASPLTLNPETGAQYGPEFPLATIRDDCRLHKLVLDDLRVKSVAICIGGSMAGMHVFEWAMLGDYVKLIVPISAPAKSSAWSISWTEAQRHSIFADPKYLDGYYSLDCPPLQGMTAARMTAMLTYRTRDSYERRFGRDMMDQPRPFVENGSNVPAAATVHRLTHNEGHSQTQKDQLRTTANMPTPVDSPSISGYSTPLIEKENAASVAYEPPQYAAHSYLRYQASKFNERFDANCYIALSRKMDAHDISYGRGNYEDVVHSIQQPVLVIGIESDILYPMPEIQALSNLLPHSELMIVRSAEGHDGILLEHEQINDRIVAFLQKHDHIREILAQEGVAVPKKGPRATLFASW